MVREKFAGRGAGGGFSARLRESTLDDHRAAEAEPFVAALVSGGLTRAGYAALAGQHWFIYGVLEEAAGVMRHDPVAGPFVSDDLHRLPALAADLELLLGPDWRDRVEARPATLAYQQRLHETCFTWPAGFIAHHYTRYLGDVSGGQVIRRAMVRQHGLTDGRGVAFYDFAAVGPPPAFRRRYRQRLDALPYAEAELSQLAAEVRVAYQLNAGVFRDLARGQPVPHTLNG